MPATDDHRRIPEAVPSLTVSEFEYADLEKVEGIGKGGDADVYRAKLTLDGQTYTVALKLPRFAGTIQRRVIRDFQSEAETWTSLDDHNNIVSVYDWGTEPLPWLALEYMDAGTLESRLGEVDFSEALWLARRVADGVRHGHRHGVAHLDIKPTNVLLRDTGGETWAYPKVSDWGLSKILLEHSDSVEGFTPTYAAPEQFEAEQYGSPDDLTDIYQLGALTYALMVGEPPFSGSTMTVMQDILNNDPVPPSNVDPDIPAEVDDVVLKALEKDKSDRYKTAIHFRDELDRLFADHISNATGASSDVAGSTVTESEGGTEVPTDSRSPATTETSTPTSTDRESRSASSPEGSRDELRSAGDTDGGSSSSGSSSSGTRIVTRRRALATIGLSVVGAGAWMASQETNSADESSSSNTNGGTGPAVGGTTRTVQGTYVSASSVDAQSLNWLTIADATSGSFVTATLDGIWAIKPNREIFPLWGDYSTDDGRVYEIELRENLEWGAGYGQMTADDWVYMIRNVFQAQPNWSGYPNAGDWFRVNPESGEREPIPVEQTGTHTFEIRLFDVDPSLPFKPILWRQQCIPKGILEQYVPDRDTEGLQQDEELNTLAYTGNLGPYTYDTWERSARYAVTRNDDYYLREVSDVPERFRESPYFDRQIVRVIGEESTRLGALESGEVDTAGIPPDKASRFENLPNVDVNVTPQPYLRVIVYNMRANGWEPFRSKAVRRALAFAVDKESIVSNVLRGYADVAQTMQPRWSEWYDDSQVTRFGVGDRYGAEATRSRLESALSGTEYRYDGDRLVDGDGKEVTLTIYYDSGQPTEATIAEFVAQEFDRNAGITVEPKAVSASAFQNNYVKTAPPEGTDPEWAAGVFNGGPRDVATSANPWDMSINLQFNTYPFTPASSKGFFETRGGINFYGYYPEADIGELYERASATTDETRRRELFGEVFGLISDEQPFGFLALPSSVTGYADRVAGYGEEFNTGWDSQSWFFA